MGERNCPQWGLLSVVGLRKEDQQGDLQSTGQFTHARGNSTQQTGSLRRPAWREAIHMI
jgi:hypothetical protein